MNRKLRKLLKDPYAFTRDMLGNRVTAVARRLPRVRKCRGSRRYSIIAAVYGVEKYLDDFFRSIVRQSLDFESHIQLIMVDDGSPDGSADVIAAWQKKYPRSIHYVRKENGGQASARNVGLAHATGDWVTFVDPDDFLDEHYFERVTRFLDRPDAANVALVSCNFIVFEEKTRRVRDSHPLRYRFTRGDRIVPTAELASDVQLSVNSALFRRDLLEGTALRFDESIRPTFEDAHFVNRYLLETAGRDVGFASSARYFYRKREDESSSIDRAWAKASQFDEVLERGCVDLFRCARARSDRREIPVWLQRVVLYHVVWYFKRLVDAPEGVAHLSPEQQARFKELLREIMSSIDVSTIDAFELAGVGLFHKIGMLGLYKSAKPGVQHVYVQDYDPIKGLVQLRYFHHGSPELEVFSIDGREVFPAFAKRRSHDFLGEVFAHERIVWLPVHGLSGDLLVTVGDQEGRVTLRGKVHRGAFPLKELARLRPAPEPRELRLDVRAEYGLATSDLVRRLYADAFLFMDRDTQADDNAEHLYRYVRRARPDINAFFVLRRSSHDWARLAREGFRLIEFGSLQHRLALLNAKHVISSHADEYVVSSPYGSAHGSLPRPRFTFLQHGVTKHDISGWLNSKNIECFVTASPAEHASIVESGSPYKFTEREVVLSGFPRHDALGAGSPVRSRVLAIMPTWRKSLVGAVAGAGNAREINPRFYDSEYALRWRSLLHSPSLRALVEQHGYRVQFFPHANIQPYLSWFAPPPHVETVSHSPDRSMQEILRAAAILLTDYSSVDFEVAYLRRAILYYQFDRDLVLGGGHLTRQGYFDHERDGFGPVCTDELALLEALSRILAVDGDPGAEYLARMDRTFAFRDGRACERTLDAILALDEPVHPRDRSAELLLDAARSATRLGAWSHAEIRWDRVIEGRTEARPDDAEVRLAEAKRHLGKVDEADAILARMEARGDVSEELAHERAELAMAIEDWDGAAALWGAHACDAREPAERTRARVRQAEALRRGGALDDAERALDAIGSAVAPTAARVERAELATARHDWAAAAVSWQALVDAPDAPDHTSVRLAEALAELGHADRALAIVDAYLGTPRPHERQARTLRLRLAVAARMDGSAIRERASAPFEEHAFRRQAQDR